MDRDLKEALEFDPLADAEKQTGVSYKESEFTQWVGFQSHIEHVDKKRSMLDARDDTHYGTTLADYLRIAREIGFTVDALNESFMSDSLGSSHVQEQFICLWHPEFGILMAFDTYGSKVNGGNFYYNWKPNDRMAERVTSSGSYHKVGEDDYVWIGGHDCREALRFHVAQLKEFGDFVTPWVERPWLWLLHYGEKKEADNYKEINDRKIAAFPETVRAGMGLSCER